MIIGLRLLLIHTYLQVDDRDSSQVYREYLEKNSESLSFQLAACKGLHTALVHNLPFRI